MHSLNKNSKNFNSYRTFCTNINYLLLNKIMKIPNYVKIDVDGIEHLILEGFGKFLKNKLIKSISVEVNEDLPEQCKKVKKILLNNNFQLIRPYPLREKNYEEKKNYKIKNLIFNKLWKLINYFTISTAACPPCIEKAINLYSFSLKISVKALYSPTSQPGEL